MSKLSEAKILGGIGALLMLLGGFAVPGLGGIIGLILIFIAVKYISEECKDKSIFDYYLFQFIYKIIAIVAVFVIFFISVGGFTFFTALESIDFTDFNTVWNFFEPYLIWWIIAILVGWVFLIISSIYLKKCYYSIADHTKVKLFRTTGLIYLIGAITLIIGIGFIIIFIAQILEIIVYLRLPAKLPSK